MTSSDLTFPASHTIGPWTFVWEGGRLADVFHAESDTAQDCVQVGDYDFAKSGSEAHTHNGMASLVEAAEKWVNEQGGTFAANLS